jgi:hypothetical protein
MNSRLSPLGLALVRSDRLYAPIGNLVPRYDAGFFRHDCDPQAKPD